MQRLRSPSLECDRERRRTRREIFPERMDGPRFPRRVRKLALRQSAPPTGAPAVREIGDHLVKQGVLLKDGAIVDRELERFPQSGDAPDEEGEPVAFWDEAAHWRRSLGTGAPSRGNGRERSRPDAFGPASARRGEVGPGRRRGIAQPHLP